MSVCIVDWICSIYLIDSAHWMCHYWICLCLLSVGSYLLDHSFYTYFCYRYLSSSTLSSLSLQTSLKTRDFLLTNWQLTSNLQHSSDIKYFISINIKFLLSITASKNNCKIVSVYHLLCHLRTNIPATIINISVSICWVFQDLLCSLWYQIQYSGMDWRQSPMEWIRVWERERHSGSAINNLGSRYSDVQQVTTSGYLERTLIYLSFISSTDSISP